MTEFCQFRVYIYETAFPDRKKTNGPKKNQRSGKKVKAVFEAGQRPVRARVHPECGPHRGGASGVINWDAGIMNLPQCLSGFPGF